MTMLQGQTKQAAAAYRLRQLIPEQLRSFIDVRPTQSALTVVSLFDYAPMRGIDHLTEPEAEKALAGLGMAKRVLCSPTKTDKEKQGRLRAEGFPLRRQAGLREEDVQAYSIRDLLAGGPESRTIAEYLGWPGVDYLTSELAYTANGKTDRVDILCGCPGEPHRLAIIELKRGRTTVLSQNRYATAFRENEAAIREFIAALTGTDATASPLEVKTLYLMAWHRGNATVDWNEQIRKAGVDGLFFFATGFPTVSIVGEPPEGGLLPVDHRYTQAARRLAAREPGLTVSRLQQAAGVADPVGRRLIARFRQEGLLA